MYKLKKYIVKFYFFNTDMYYLHNYQNYCIDLEGMLQVAVVVVEGIVHLVVYYYYCNYHNIHLCMMVEKALNFECNCNLLLNQLLEAIVDVVVDNNNFDNIFFVNMIVYHMVY
jgi:hypothetical protein